MVLVVVAVEVLVVALLVEVMVLLMVVGSRARKILEYSNVHSREHSREHYRRSIRKIVRKNSGGLFSYILQSSGSWLKLISSPRILGIAT